MQSKIWKILLISILSGCAGTPPKLERPVSYYAGIPERSSMCRNVKSNLVDFLKKIAKHQGTRDQVENIVNTAFQADPLGVECVKADEPNFAALVGISADDLRVLLQYMENLVYKCERWKQ